MRRKNFKQTKINKTRNSPMIVKIREKHLGEAQEISTRKKRIKKIRLKNTTFRISENVHNYRIIMFRNITNCSSKYSRGREGEGEGGSVADVWVVLKQLKSWQKKKSFAMKKEEARIIYIQQCKYLCKLL